MRTTFLIPFLFLTCSPMVAAAMPSPPGGSMTLHKSVTRGKTATGISAGRTVRRVYQAIKSTPVFCGYNDLSIPELGVFEVTEYDDGTVTERFLNCL